MLFTERVLSNIDFVLLWVDGNDPEWQKDRERFSGENGDNRNIRFRDWQNLKYIFRAFEKFTPWVRKIHFVSYGHLPTWLNREHPKINIVNHQDYIDKEYLPVFNANPLEISMHKIRDLSEQFVYFNDDTFIIKAVKEERFFKWGLPRDVAVSNALSSSIGVGHFVLNAVEILNRHFSKHQAIKENLPKWFSLLYGKEMIRNAALLPWPRFTGFVDPHMPQPFLKSTFKEVWDLERDRLEKTMRSRFRDCEDVNQYLFRYWQLAKGNFIPVSMKDTKYLTLTPEGIERGELEEALLSGRYRMVCLNDSEAIGEEESFEWAKKRVIEIFDKLLPEPSSFEVDQ
ncbi:hypothetical protein Nitsa_1995 [Nitratifractor salsuginis DSM 16511]|uniref:Uncharacterized protein n=1 Tax=Nitratifractor salsuginis (strain DSM 16511 / JCM 12458 / E9I37-1) TaxID=749222 RepID=E6X2V5_NITSE|nr:hypothetical protein Nitsa_1995 [Nitratifractor salsuginis DSM 16511]